ncbi:acyl carrier protein [Ureaplasma parvum]|jgi:acyl carrier protein|uniref:Acyl carrier protein homolog n=4 Tax=Ureaplasma parvum TaxID=134821 RepID=ACPH_UREPA|nr:acyl carrier protein [Ureaplasma parvum]Q9PPY4.1 RecName: Full=Acyl carrier protein homolog; Short=ACP [Ureaplasma parvum serovar 3 str. ATCC 700970]pir/G82881/ acyl carrier protein UU506 [imported] - Ureaplasma urealyticum [Ureaplasma urealyticum]AAF30918.1 acyl carrier protein [Ureaplasma parvum serovar 3 str. ATCC 700970]ACA32739.1 acyl carrier protein [Ureaplasma parvum serovar 3 str. ATCC 27815]ASD24732.1 acyl carrier protein [Ureaplasma parvum]ASD24996.1 acyl carrier protein [Ureapla
MSINIKDLIMKIAKENKIALNMDNLNIELKSLGIDSLSAMNLIMKIEDQIGVQLPDEKLLKIKNLRDLINAFEDVLK